MKQKSRNSGVTFIELLISSAIIATVILASISLISRIYKGIITTQFKTYSISIASEHLDIMKHQGFNNLNITPDDCLPDPIYNLDAANCPANPYPVETVPFAARNMYVYKVVQYANEDANDNMVPRTLGELGAGGDMNTKMITVIVAYELDGNTKTTKISGLVTNREIPLSGSTVSGTIYKRLANSSLVAPGAGSNATVYFVGFPGYTTQQYDANGNFTVQGIMPGSYILYAAGVGMETTYYANNPLVISNAGSTITNVDFQCPEIIGASLQGRVYIDITMVPSHTPTRTPTIAIMPTETPITGSSILLATGSMPGRTSDWSNPGNINLNDGQVATGNNTNNLLYTTFQSFSMPNSVITGVSVHGRIASISLFGVSSGIRLHITNNNGANFATTASPAAWTGTITTIYASWNYPSILSGYVQRSTTLTGLYTNWTAANVNSLGVVFRHNTSTTGYIDNAWLQVDYRIQTPTPTVAAPTATHTPTPIPTNTPIPCADGSIVRSLDGLSMQTTSVSCNYTINNINAASGFTSVSATFSYGGKSYYQYITGVPVTAGVTTLLDIYLQETTGIPTVTGFVYDAINRTVPIAGADVYLSDPVAVSPTTSGGGIYTFMPANTGNWQLSAGAPGYKIENVHNIAVYNGINNAPHLYLYPVGDISGRVTDDTTGDPVSGISIEVRNAANTLVGVGASLSDGSYLIRGIPATSGYRVRAVLSSGIYVPVFPVLGHHSGVSVSRGIVTANKDFKIKPSYMSIEGYVAIDSLDITEGVVIAAYPSSVTILAHHYRTDSPAPHLQGQGGRSKVAYPYFGIVSQRDASFNIQVPVGTNYNIYAYYSYISYTGTVSQPIKTLKKYFKAVNNVAPGSSGIAITGALSTWTEY